MDTGKAIFLGLALIALAIFATDAMHPAQAGAHQIGRYIIASNRSNSAWIKDTSTGRYRLCIPRQHCYPWSSGLEVTSK